jgi:hypothetical protein
VLRKKSEQETKYRYPTVSQLKEVNVQTLSRRALNDRSGELQGLGWSMRPAGDGWSAEDWQVFFDKRAGIAELDGGLPRTEAEARAFACCLAEWQNRNFVPSPPERCLACGCSDHPRDPILPYGMESIGYAWLHSRCWPAWHAGRKVAAAAALAGMGIP